MSGLEQQESQRWNPVRSAEAEKSFPEPGLQRELLAYDPNLMLVRNSMEKGWVGTLHSHPHHQAIYILKGRIQFEAKGKMFELLPGDSLVVEGGVEHQARALEDSEVLDVFTPYREDFVE